MRKLMSLRQEVETTLWPLWLDAAPPFAQMRNENVIFRHYSMQIHLTLSRL
jgi:hypothetical protein